MRAAKISYLALRALTRAVTLHAIPAIAPARHLNNQLQFHSSVLHNMHAQDISSYYDVFDKFMHCKMAKGCSLVHKTGAFVAMREAKVTCG